MGQFDSEQVRKIWQRVQGEKAKTDNIPFSKEPCPGIPEAVVRELSCAAIYTALSKQLPPMSRNMLHRLAREEQQHAAVLKGVCTLSGGFCPPVKPIPIPKAPAMILLRRCYGQKLQAIAEYEKRFSDPVHGTVFRKIAEQEQNQCRILLQLIGNGMHK